MLATVAPFELAYSWEVEDSASRQDSSLRSSQADSAVLAWEEF